MSAILFMLPLVDMPEQDVIRMAYMRYIINMKQQSAPSVDVDVLLCTPKQNKLYREKGWTDKLKQAGVNVLDVSECWVKSPQLHLAIDTKKLGEVLCHQYSEVSVCGLLHRSCKTLYCRAFHESVFTGGTVDISHTFGSSLVSLKRIWPLFFVMNRDIPVVEQYVVDWMEFNLQHLRYGGKVVQYGHYARHDDMWFVKYNGLYERYLIEQRGNQHFEKEIDFCFGYTCTDQTRHSLSDTITALGEPPQGVRAIICGYDKKSGMKNSLPQTAYLSKIRRAKVSMIVPSYDRTQFSYMRLCECIINDCVPVIACHESQYKRHTLAMKHIFEENGWVELWEWYASSGLFITYDCLTWDAIMKYVQQYESNIAELRKIFLKIFE